MATSQQLELARTDAYQRRITDLRTLTTAQLLLLFRTGSYRDADVTTFLKVAVPRILAARQQSASLTTAHLSQRLKALDFKAPAPRPVDTASLRGVPVQDVYSRPFQQVWTDLSRGSDLPEAVTSAERRLTSLVETDLQLAKTNAAQSVFEQARSPRGNLLYQRTLKGPENCALCVVASTQIYGRSDLMPIHPGCDCDVDPILDIATFKTDAAQRLVDAHDAVNEALGVSDSGARAPDYRKLVVVREHGEYGPTLVVAKHRFTGPDSKGLNLTDLPRAS